MNTSSVALSLNLTAAEANDALAGLVAHDFVMVDVVHVLRVDVEVPERVVVALDVGRVVPWKSQVVISLVWVFIIAGIII